MSTFHQKARLSEWIDIDTQGITLPNRIFCQNLSWCGEGGNYLMYRSSVVSYTPTCVHMMDSRMTLTSTLATHATRFSGVAGHGRRQRHTGRTY